MRNLSNKILEQLSFLRIFREGKLQHAELDSVPLTSRFINNEQNLFPNPDIFAIFAADFQ